jgi:hypothetical protein
MRLLIITLGSLLLVACSSSQTQGTAPPDFSGLWTPDASQAQDWPSPLPLTPQAAAAMAAFEPDRQDPTGFCMPYGTPRNTLATGSAMEVLQRPDRVYFTFQPNLLNAETRRVYLDGRAVPAGEDLVPTWLGVSRGKWEGDTLVVETTGIEPQAIISGNGLPHSDGLKVTERWRLTVDGKRGRQLINEMTLEDPLLYTAPIRTRRVFAWSPEATLADGQCSERLWIDNLWRYRLAEHAVAARAGKARQPDSVVNRRAGVAP